MEEKVQKLYNLENCPESLLEEAYQEWINYEEFPYYEEMENTGKYFCEYFDILVDEYYFTDFFHPYELELGEEFSKYGNLKGIELYNFVNENFGNFIRNIEKLPITGKFTDYWMLYILYEFLEKFPNGNSFHNTPYQEITFLELINDTIDCYLHECEKKVDEFFGWDNFLFNAKYWKFKFDDKKGIYCKINRKYQ